MALHISISAEPIFHLGSIPITNSMFVSWLVTGFLCSLALISSKIVKPTRRPKGLQAFIETITESLYSLVSGISGERLAKQIFPYIATFFLFILLGNWAGLLPGVGTIGFIEKNEVATSEVNHEPEPEGIPPIAEKTHPLEPAKSEAATEEPIETMAQEHRSEPASTESHESEEKFVPYLRGATADLNVTLALAIVSVALTQYVGLKNLGIKYLGKFINFSNPIQFFIGILELVAEFAKIMSFAFRLFGNIFAGEVLLSVMAFLVPIIAPLPFIGLEIFVGFVQALVFSMLTMVFMNLATISHSEEH